eukprot:TRINITY_DN1704_c0_g1_i3.p1 TRINITY_DN1704_c0_g1~~TRINITY_DN1704_c0_g1_i3.p1  ORF type:complete len:381 (+),score=82.04 TRINITY_DN1704_c0_g1_i3:900-2042(+)
MVKHHRETLPKEIKHILNAIRTEADLRWKDEEVTHMSVSTFILLRFLTPALMNPKMFDLMDYIPSSNQIEDYKIFASFVQKLGNLSVFLENNDMHQLNDILLDNHENMKEFIDGVSETVLIEGSYQCSSGFIELVIAEYSIMTRMLISLRTNCDFEENSVISFLDELIFLIHVAEPTYWESQHDFTPESMKKLEEILKKRNDKIRVRKRRSSQSQASNQTQLKKKTSFRKSKKSDSSLSDDEVGEVKQRSKLASSGYSVKRKKEMYKNAFFSTTGESGPSNRKITSLSEIENKRTRADKRGTKSIDDIGVWENKVELKDQHLKVQRTNPDKTISKKSGSHDDVSTDKRQYPDQKGLRRSRRGHTKLKRRTSQSAEMASPI